MEIPNLKEIENIDSYLNESNLSLFNQQSEMNIDFKIKLILNYTSAIIENKPRKISDSRKYVSEKTIETINSFYSFNLKYVDSYKKNEKEKRLKNAIIGGAFIINALPERKIKEYMNNGKVINISKNKTLKKVINDEYINLVRRYENLLKHLK